MKYPVLLVHGFGFRDRKRLNYWGRIPKLLENKGIKVFYGNQDSSATIETNSRILKERLESILKETGAEKVNIIAHSKGGLEARYLISTLRMQDKIASLTTVGTPHRGSKTIEIVPSGILKIIGFFMDIGMWILGDRHPDAYIASLAFRTDKAAEFNVANPDSPDVYYQSYACAMNRDVIFWITHRIISRIEGENDGMVTTASAIWGDFKGVKRSNSKRGISHSDEVDFRRRRFTKKTGEGVSDVLEIYSEIIETLHAKGF